MKFLDLKPLLKLVWKPLALSIVAIIGIALIPNKNLLTINLFMLSFVLTTELLNKNRKPDPKRWLMLSGKTMLAVSGFLILWSWLGVFGLFGIILGILLLAAFRIWQGWELFDAATSWGARRLKGSNEDLDLTRVALDGKSKNEGIGSTDAKKSFRRRDKGGSEQSFEPVGVVKNCEEVVQTLQEHGVQAVGERGEVQKGSVVCDVSDDIRKKRGRSKKAVKVSL